jgi:PKD repeat protein
MALGVEADTQCDWDVGDGTKGTGLAVVHTYWSPGTCTIKLSAGGRTAEAKVVVAEAPGK